MKRYVKDNEIKFRDKIVLHRTETIIDADGNKKAVNITTFFPTEEQLLAAGWKEYITPIYEPTIEDIRKRKKEEILRYDSSDEVNTFYMQGQQMWLDKATRAGLMLRLQAEQALGKETTTLWYSTHQFELPIVNAFQMLYTLELYASQCYDNTQHHLAAVDALESKEDIEAYDYRTGYPEKLEL